MKVLLIVCALFFVGSVQAETGMFVTKIYTKTLFVYDDNGEEIDELKADVVRDELSEPIPGKDEPGLRVDDVNVDEGLVRVSLEKYPDGAWLETMAVEIWPDNRLTCPEVTTGQAEVDQSGMTIGFGEHCEKSAQQ